VLGLLKHAWAHVDSWVSISGINLLFCLNCDSYLCACGPLVSCCWSLLGYLITQKVIGIVSVLSLSPKFADEGSYVCVLLYWAKRLYLLIVANRSHIFKVQHGVPVHSKKQCCKPGRISICQITPNRSLPYNFSTWLSKNKKAVLSQGIRAMPL